MQKITVSGMCKTSAIYVGESLQNLDKYLPENKKVIVITDFNVGHFYKEELAKYEVVKIGIGEKIKNLYTVQKIYERLLKEEVDRSCFIVGVGGGVVCDVTGFVASTYMRGIDFGFVSTTLLSQVDASVGGKNGVNFQGFKNIIGTFNQPNFIICATDMLQTLPQKELLSGFAEIVKHAFIKSDDLFNYIEQNYEKALSLDAEVIEKLVCDSINIKAAVVSQDEKEKGVRQVLNFGHTLGHAYESTVKPLHGEAVSAGMIFAAEFSMSKGYLSQDEFAGIKMLLEKIGLPLSFNVESRRLINAIKKDKKRSGSDINFVFLKGIGNALIEKIALSELENYLRR